MTWRTQPRYQKDRGSYSVETAILAPAVIAILLLMIALGRVVDASGSVDAAARAAARAASLERDANSAQLQAQDAATRSLDGEGVTCSATSVEIDTTDFALEVGEAGTVTATISCTAPLSDIGLPGLPGAKTLISEWTSPIDTYRSRS